MRTDDNPKNVFKKSKKNKYNHLSVHFLVKIKTKKMKKKIFHKKNYFLFTEISDIEKNDEKAAK